MAAIEFRLPDVGEGIATAELVDWRVAVGDHVREGQDLAEVQTDKAIVVIPCPTKGTVVRLSASAGEILDVGGVLAVFEADEPEEAPAPGRSRALAAPAMRRLARELGIDLAGVRGSGPHGRIVRQDLQVPPPPPPPSAPRPGQTVPLRGVRAAIARTLTRAWQEIPHVIDYREVDASQLISLRGVLKQRALDSGDERLARALSPTPLIVRAAARALADHPYVNSSIDLERGEITLHEQINIAVATATPDGLTVPVVHDADGKSIPELALAIAELVADARGRRLHPEQLAGSTFTVNNYGGLGIWLGTPIIRPPEVANLGVGAVRDRVVPVDGVPAVRPVLALAVSGDHRVLDGDTLAAFVTQVVRLLEEPLLLLEEFR